MVMASTTILWAGKVLSGPEEVRLRRLVHALRRAGNADLADDFERFLPERQDAWSVDELAGGAHVGPCLYLEAEVDGPADRKTA
jgi:hypothetical protein